MGENTKIEWAHHTFNPWIGCTKVAPACDHCYAEADFATRRKVVQWGAGQPRKLTADSTWALPRRWNKEAERLGVRYRVFCASLADVFDNEVPTQWRISLVKLILDTPHLDWLLLTKRIGNAAGMLETAFRAVHAGREGWADNVAPNVWIGASITSQAEADRDIPKLLAVPAAKRFLSMEPLLGPVDLGAWIGDESCHVCRTRFYGDEMNLRPGGVKTVDFEDQPEDEDDIRKVCPNCQTINTCGEVDVVDEEEMGGGLHWVIVGGESGPNARPMHPDWACSLRDQCQAAGVPFLFKQWGEWKPINQMEEAEHGQLYVPKVKAKPHEDQGNLDDIYGRNCTVPFTVVHLDGSTHDITEPMAFLQGTGAMQTFKVGKKAAGRLLDGVEHNGTPDLPDPFGAQA